MRTDKIKFFHLIDNFSGAHIAYGETPLYHSARRLSRLYYHSDNIRKIFVISGIGQIIVVGVVRIVIFLFLLHQSFFKFLIEVALIVGFNLLDDIYYFLSVDKGALYTYAVRIFLRCIQHIAFAEQREELERAYYESLTQVSFDSVYDSFIDTLMDMEAGWEEMADDMSGYLMRALLKTKLDEVLKPEMEDWHRSFGEAMTDGSLSEDERDALSSWWNNMVAKGLELRDNAAAATGYTGESEGTTQSGKAGSFSAMSQEQGTKLEGLFTSGQMHWASIDEQMQDVSEQMGTAVDHLRRIEENTGNSARHLDEIKNDIKKIIRDGLKMK